MTNSLYYFGSKNHVQKQTQTKTEDLRKKEHIFNRINNFLILMSEWPICINENLQKHSELIRGFTSPVPLSLINYWEHFGYSPPTESGVLPPVEGLNRGGHIQTFASCFKLANLSLFEDWKWVILFAWLVLLGFFVVFFVCFCFFGFKWCQLPVWYILSATECSAAVTLKSSNREMK